MKTCICVYLKFLELTICILIQYPQALQSWQNEIVSFLLDHHANPHVKDNNGNCALHYAVYAGQPDVVVKLLQCGANIEERTKVKFTNFEIHVM